MKRIHAFLTALLAVVATLALGMAMVPLSARAEDPATVNMNVRSLGHGTVLVNGTDYGAEFQGTWPEGEQVQIEAVPDAGYRLDRWWIRSTSSNRRETTPQITLVAGTDAEAQAIFCLETAYVTITPPAAGTTAEAKPQVTVPSGAGYAIQEDGVWGSGLRWVESAEHNAATLAPTTVFEAGETYYARLRLHEGSDSFGATAGGAEANTNLSATGGEKQWQSNGAYTEETGSGEYSGYIAIEAVIAVTIPEATTHTVTFDTQGGTPVSSQTVNDGEYAAKPANPSKDGFYFKGWYEKPGSELTRDEVYNGQFKFTDTAISEDKTLYAVWYQGFYGATYDLSAATPKYAATGGRATFTSTYQQMSPGSGYVWWNHSIVEGSEVTVTAIPAEGSRFVGWAPGTLDSNDNMPNDPSSLGEIVSTANPYTFTFNGRTALAALFESEAPKHELSFAFTNLYPGAQPQALLESLTVNGEDWTPTSGNNTAKDIPAGSSVTATVKVTDNASLATYNNPENTISDLVPTYSDDGSKLTFTFTMPETDARIVVYLFEAVTVTYDANGGVKQPAWADSVKWMKYTASTPATINVSQELYDMYSDEPRVLPAEGYEFDGIEVTQNKTGAKVTGKQGETITVDFSEGGTIKFLWMKDVTVTFDAKGGTPVPNEQHLRAGEKAGEPTSPTKEGWEQAPGSLGGGFGGWYTDESYTNEFDFSTPVENDITLYARWDGRIDVTAYDQTNDKALQGGTFSCSSVYESVTGMYQYGCPWIAEGSTVTLTATPDAGYRFVRWEKPGLDAPVIVSTNATYEFTFTDNPTTLYAVFEVKPLTITLVPTTIDGATPVENYEFEIMPGQSFEDVDGSDAYKTALAHFMAAEGYIPYYGDLYLLPDQLSNYSDWGAVENADLYSEPMNENTTLYVPLAKSVETIELTVEKPLCGTEVWTYPGPDGIGYYQKNPPVVTAGADCPVEIPSGEDSSFPPTAWVNPDSNPDAPDTEGYNPFLNDTLVGGQSYTAIASLALKFGYTIDEDNPPEVTVENADSAELHLLVFPRLRVMLTVTVEHDWGEWKVTKEPTEEAEGEEARACKHCDATETRPIPKLVVEYKFVAGDGSVYTQGSEKPIAFIVKRNIADEKTFGKTVDVLVDGVALTDAQATLTEGSLVITLKGAYLETLAPGSHTITAQFEDGEAEATFTVQAADTPTPAPTPKPAPKPTPNPATGEPASMAGLLAAMGGALMLVSRRKKQ